MAEKKKEDQATGEGVAPSKSRRVRAAVKSRVDQLNQPNNAAFKKQVRALQETALQRRKKRAKKKVVPDKPPSAIENEPTRRGIQKAFAQAAEARRKAEEARRRKK